jgi:hypothetical protein
LVDELGGEDVGAAPLDRRTGPGDGCAACAAGDRWHSSSGERTDRGAPPIEDARTDGVELTITSGWRSAEHQQRLFDDAVRKYGSRAEARHWVLPPEESAHVTGSAVDVGPPAGAAWLRANGERYGLCQVYANEPWHFERLAGAVGSRCPALLPHA